MFIVGAVKTADLKKYFCNHFFGLPLIFTAHIIEIVCLHPRKGVLWFIFNVDC